MSEHDYHFANCKEALRLGLISWTQYFELIVYRQLKVTTPGDRPKRAA